MLVASLRLYPFLLLYYGKVLAPPNKLSYKIYTLSNLLKLIFADINIIAFTGFTRDRNSAFKRREDNLGKVYRRFFK